MYIIIRKRPFPDLHLQRAKRAQRNSVSGDLHGNFVAACFLPGFEPPTVILFPGCDQSGSAGNLARAAQCGQSFAGGEEKSYFAQ